MHTLTQAKPRVRTHMTANVNRAAYTDAPTFGLLHAHVNHEETQSGLGPLDDATYTHLIGAAERMDTYVFLLGDHGAHYGRCNT